MRVNATQVDNHFFDQIPLPAFVLLFLLSRARLVTKPLPPCWSQRGRQIPSLICVFSVIAVTDDGLAAFEVDTVSGRDKDPPRPPPSSLAPRANTLKKERAAHVLPGDVTTHRPQKSTTSLERETFPCKVK